MHYPRLALPCLVLAFLLCCSPVSAEVSVNVPVGHWSYRVLDKLSGMGLIQSGMLSTKPITRLQAAKLLREAEQAYKRAAGTEQGMGQSRADMVRGLLLRMRGEFGAELAALTNPARSSLKPVEDVRLTHLHGEEVFDLENDKREPFAEGHNTRLTVSSHGTYSGYAGYFLQPELAYSEDGLGEDKVRADILQGYGKLEWGNLELEAGRDSLWWGPGRHGSLILTDNAPPLNLIKLSNPEPFQLPWLFRHLGLIKAVGFLSELESGRDVPNAQLMGMRVSIKPFPYLELGGSRVIMLGGEGGSKGVEELNQDDWGTVLSGRNVVDDRDTNQIAGGDVTLRIPRLDRWLPLASTKLWLECYGEDEAGHLPSKPAWVAGITLNDLFLRGKTDLTMEYADTVVSNEGRVWYTHSVYNSGYRYRDQILGHHLGTDARGYFVELEHYLSPDFLLKLTYNRQKSGIDTGRETERNSYDIEVNWFYTEKWQVQGRYRHETTERDETLDGPMEEENNILGLTLNYSF